MPSIFLSHSSLDKAFVNRLAADLTLRGYPVWFDSWELEAGDSLYERVFNGIEASNMLLLAISHNSIKSKWVTKELEGAFAKEDRLGRKVIIPLKIDDCEPPLMVAARIFIDFTRGYQTGFEALEDLLTKSGATASPPEKQLVPLVFRRACFLNETELERLFQKICIDSASSIAFTVNQFFVLDDGEYSECRNRFSQLVENYRSSVNYRPENEATLSEMYLLVRNYESILLRGMVHIVNGIRTRGGRNAHDIAQALHWFGRLVRSCILNRMSRGYTVSGQEVPPLLSPYQGSVLLQPTDAARFYEVSAVQSFELFSKKSKGHIRVYINDDSEIGKWFAKHPLPPIDLEIFYYQASLSKYIVPQMMFHHLIGNEPLEWSFAGWRIGLA